MRKRHKTEDAVLGFTSDYRKEQTFVRDSLEALQETATLYNCFLEWEQCRSDEDILLFLENIAKSSSMTLKSISNRLHVWRTRRVPEFANEIMETEIREHLKERN